MFALSKTIYIAQCLPCPITISNQITSALTIFLWKSHPEKPQKNPMYRLPCKGGLSLPNPELFYKSLFLRPVFNTLTSPNAGPEVSLLRYWLAFELKDLIPGIHEKNGIFSPHQVPAYLKTHLSTLKELLNTKLVDPTRTFSHRKIYWTWLGSIHGPGKMEISYPQLDWQTIWLRTSQLPPRVKECFFLYSHRLMFFRVQASRNDPKRVSSICQFCHLEPEDDTHVFLGCSKRAALKTWLEKELQKLQCKTPMREAIRGHIGQVPNPRTTFNLIAAYIFMIWKRRQDQRIPTIADIERTWASLNPKNVPQA